MNPGPSLCFPAKGERGREGGIEGGSVKVEGRGWKGIVEEIGFVGVCKCVCVGGGGGAGTGLSLFHWSP
jgi:hypothetical protein